MLKGFLASLFRRNVSSRLVPGPREVGREVELSLALHDINNLLMAASTHLERSTMGMDAEMLAALGEARVKGLERAKLALLRCAQISSAASRISATELSHQTASVRESIELALELVPPKTVAASKVEVDNGIAPGVRVRGDLLTISRILSNLVINGCQALEGVEEGDGGLVPTVRVSAQECMVPSGVRMVRITVEDNGPGVAASLRERILAEPLSTKSVSAEGIGGRGLALFASKKLLEEFGGQLVLESGSERGARFSVYLRHV